MDTFEVVMMNIKRREFKDWLLSLPKGAEVGRARLDGSCPIANYVKKDTGYTFVQVYPGFGYRTSIQSLIPTKFKLPKWSAKFIEAVDKVKSDRPITREKALEILRRIQ